VEKKKLLLYALKKEALRNTSFPRHFHELPTGVTIDWIKLTRFFTCIFNTSAHDI